MAVPTSIKREFIRYVYRTDTTATVDGRDAVITDWSSTSLASLQGATVLTQSSANGKAVGFMPDLRWTISDVISLADWARNHISDASVTDALAGINLPVRTLAASFTGLSCH